MVVVPNGILANAKVVKLGFKIARIGFTKLKPNATVPTYATEGSVGADLYAVEGSFIDPGCWKLIGTGVAICLPDGYEAQVRSRSGIALKHGVTVLNSPGSIDSDFRGEIGVILINHSKQVFRIHPGDRIAQLVIASVARVTFNEVPREEFDGYTTDRGSGGFGSTGVH